MSGMMQALGYPSAESAKRALFEELRKVGAVRLEASYSGGNDEGGVDDITVLKNAAGEDLTVPDSWDTRDPKPGEDVAPWQRDKDGKVREYNPLWRTVDEMLSVEFGSWAGEFSAYGTIYADLSEGRVWREGSIQQGYDDSRAEY